MIVILHADIHISYLTFLFNFFVLLYFDNKTINNALKKIPHQNCILILEISKIQQDFLTRIIKCGRYLINYLILISILY